jgi:hypothetical protein
VQRASLYRIIFPYRVGVGTIDIVGSREELLDAMDAIRDEADAEVTIGRFVEYDVKNVAEDDGVLGTGDDHDDDYDDDFESQLVSRDLSEVGES